jgi:hypothetical protein
MKGEYFGIITAVCWAVGIFPFTMSTRYFQATHINLMRLLLALVLLCPFIILKAEFFQVYILGKTSV